MIDDYQRQEKKCKNPAFFFENILSVSGKVLPLHSLSLKMGWEPSSLTDLHETVVVQEAINFFWLRDFLFKSTDTVILNQTLDKTKKITRFLAASAEKACFLCRVATKRVKFSQKYFTM